MSRYTINNVELGDKKPKDYLEAGITRILLRDLLATQKDILDFLIESGVVMIVRHTDNKTVSGRIGAFRYEKLD